MAVEQFSNNGQTTLNGGINAGAGTLVVASPTNFPTVGNFRLLIDSEILLVTAVSSDSFTVTRGQEGTAAATHATGAAVTLPLTKQSLLNLRSDALPRGTAANLPAEGVNGRIYLPTDSDILWHDNGSSWQPYSWVYPLTTPAGGFSWVNQSTATETVQADGSVVLSISSNGSGNNANLRVKTIPAAPYTITAAFIVNLYPKEFSLCGLCLRESGSGKFVTAGLEYGVTPSGLKTWIGKYTSPTVYSADYYVNLNPFTLRPFFVRYLDDNTNRWVYMSGDGFNWIPIHKVGRTDFCTPDQYGYMVDQTAGTLNGVNPTAGMILQSLLVTTP